MCMCVWCVCERYRQTEQSETNRDKHRETERQQTETDRNREKDSGYVYMRGREWAGVV